METTQNDAVMKLMVQSSYDLIHPLVMAGGDLGKWLNRDDTNALAISGCLIAGAMVGFAIASLLSEIKTLIKYLESSDEPVQVDSKPDAAVEKEE